MGWFDSIFGDDDVDTGVADSRPNVTRPRDPLGRIPPEPAFDAFRSAWNAGAGLLDLFGDDPVRIKQPVGPQAPNRRPDIAKVETFLGRSGHLDLARTEGPTGYYGSRVDQGIRRFQKDSALEVDGLINPDGPTLGTLRSLLSGDDDAADRAPRSSADGRGVGPGALASGAAERPAARAPSPLADRVADWLGRRTATAAHTDDPPSRPAAQSPAFAGPPAVGAPGKRPEREPLSAARGGEDHAGAWFEGGPIPDSATHDDPVAAENYMRGKIDSWRRTGLNDAAGNLERYLQGKGGIVSLSRDEARKFKHVREGEIENTRQFLENTFLARNTKTESALKLRDIKDGDTWHFEDRWDHDLTPDEAALEYMFGDANLALAYGANKIRSKGKFTARRRSDTITIEGVIRHTWNEQYDFEKGQPGAAEGHTLERHGKAKPYRSIAQWEEPVRAKVRIRNGRPEELEELEWGTIRDLTRSVKT